MNYALLTDEEIQKIANKAERTVITGDISHKDIGMKVGLFSQAASITWQMDQEKQKAAIKKVQTDLVVMNRKDEWQHKKAQAAQ